MRSGIRSSALHPSLVTWVYASQFSSQSVVKSVRGQIVKATGCNDNANADYGSMYGIAAYGNKVLGFSHQGFIVTIDNTTGAACLALSTSSDSWAGAAITTVAQIVPPTQ